MATGRVTVDRTTTFRIELTNTLKSKYLGLEEYSMEALDDQKPIVEFTKPGRDTKATKVEEVFTELRAEDDFGVRQLELYYSVNGGPEQKVDLFAAKGENPTLESSMNLVTVKSSARSDSGPSRQRSRLGGSLVATFLVTCVPISMTSASDNPSFSHAS